MWYVCRFALLVCSSNDIILCPHVQCVLLFPLPERSSAIHFVQLFPDEVEFNIIQQKCNVPDSGSYKSPDLVTLHCLFCVVRLCSEQNISLLIVVSKMSLCRCWCHCVPGSRLFRQNAPLVTNIYMICFTMDVLLLLNEWSAYCSNMSVAVIDTNITPQARRCVFHQIVWLILCPVLLWLIHIDWIDFRNKNTIFVHFERK
jgi:hypothetical protein